MPSLLTRLGALAYFIAVLCQPAPGAAEPPAAPIQPPGKYAPRRAFGIFDYLATAAFFGGYLVADSLDDPTETNWTGTVPLLDRPPRELFQLHSRSARDAAVEASNYLRSFTVYYAVGVSIVAPLVQGRGLNQAWQLSMMNTQALSLASFISRITHKFVGRLRPTELGCAQDPQYDNWCDGNAIHNSFVGGHAIMAMTGAGLVCAHHQHADLYGDTIADTLACGTALATASGVFVTRLLADKHWLSDQLISTALGLGIGYGIPTLFYYRPFFYDESADRSRPSSFLLPDAGPGYLGAQWLGVF